MSKKKILLVTAIICIIMFAVITIVLISRNLTGKQETPVIAFYNVNSEYYPLMLEYLEAETTGFGQKCRIIELNLNESLQTQLEASPGIDLLFAADGLAVESVTSILRPLSEEPARLLPSSLRLRGLLNNKRYAYPLELDHVEIAFRKDFFAQKGFPTGERLMSLAELEGALTALAGANFYPLMIAGADDTSLLDAVSLLTLSLGGSQAVSTLVDLIKNNDFSNNDNDFSTIVNTELAEDLSLNKVLERLAAWKKKGILHPEWLKFSREEVFNFVEDELTAALIMRLSIHRTYPLSIIKKFSESPFPFAGRENSAAGIIAPLHIVSSMKSSNFKAEADKILVNLLRTDFQKKLTHFTGLAPASATAETLDKQASNLRFWGAASRKIIESLASASFLVAHAQKAFAEEIRNYLIRM